MLAFPVTNTNLFIRAANWVGALFGRPAAEEKFPVDWRTILAYRPYHAAFSAYTVRHRYGTDEALGTTEFDRLVTRMAIYERRNFALFIIYQLARERQREDHEYYNNGYRMLQRLLSFRLWDDEHEMIYLGRAFLAFVPFDYRHLIYWPLGNFLTQATNFRRARRAQRELPTHSFLGTREALFREMLDALEPHELFGYTKELEQWRGQLEGLLRPILPEATERRRAA